MTTQENFGSNHQIKTEGIPTSATQTTTAPPQSNSVSHRDLKSNVSISYFIIKKYK